MHERRRVIHPEVKGAFRADVSGYVSRSPGGAVSSPPYVIASCALRRSAACRSRL